MADVVLNFGDLRDQIGFYTVTPTADGGGGYTSTKTLSFEIFAKIVPNGRAKIDGQGIQIFQEVFDVWIRNEVTINDTMLVKYNSKDYRILFVENVENRNKILKLRIATK
jgi:head-tail adaptor